MHCLFCIFLHLALRGCPREAQHCSIAMTLGWLSSHTIRCMLQYLGLLFPLQVWDLVQVALQGQARAVDKKLSVIRLQTTGAAACFSRSRRCRTTTQSSL